MSVFTVTTAADSVADDGKLSLREAVAQANTTAGADTIQFAAGLEGRTLVLTHGELVLRHELTIDGDRDNDGREVTLSGGGESRILRIEGGWPSPDEADVRLEDLSVIEGRSPIGENGGAILLAGGSLALAQCTVRDSRSTEEPDHGIGGDGGGIYAATGTRLALSDSTIARNEATSYGGDIGTGIGVQLSIRSSLLTGNEAYYGLPGGGAIALSAGFLVLEDSVLADTIRVSASMAAPAAGCGSGKAQRRSPGAQSLATGAISAVASAPRTAASP